MTKIKYLEGSLVGKKYKPYIEFEFCLAIPCIEIEEFALLIDHDGQIDANVNSMLKLADEGKAPYCVSVGVKPGRLVFPDGSQRGMRMNSYDLFDREYGDFLVYELIPYVEKTFAINLSKSPDMHFISGGSSGGVSAFVVAWFHSDYFHRVYMSSPSFLSMGRGNEIPYLIRKHETKPLRIYEEHSEYEANDYFGWSRPIDEEACNALSFAKYDFKYKYFKGEAHCSRYRDEKEAYERNEWIWKGWKENAITASDNSDRVNKVIAPASRWERCESIPYTENVVPEVLAQAYEKVVLSNDGKLWYAANGKDDVIYAHVNESEISLDRRILHTTLHTMPRQQVLGMIDMAVAKTDRLFVLTESGVQCVRSFGLVDVILELPDNSKPNKIAIADALYVQTEVGIYKRKLCAECINDSEEKRKQVDYAD